MPTTHVYPVIRLSFRTSRSGGAEGVRSVGTHHETFEHRVLETASGGVSHALKAYRAIPLETARTSTAYLSVPILSPETRPFTGAQGWNVPKGK